MLCENCQKREGTKSTIIYERYYQAICESCYAAALSSHSTSTGHADYERGRDFEEHEADVIQPTGRDGKPSAEFIHLYPERAKSMFTPDEIRDAYRF